MAEWPDRLPGLFWLPAYWAEVETRWAPMFKTPPDLVVMHSASTGNWPAECLNNAPAFLTAPAAAHISWYQGLEHYVMSGCELPPAKWCFVQQASLRRAVPGAGGSMCQGRGGPGEVNGRSIHIELPARPPNPQEVKAATIRLLDDLVVALPSLRYWTTHKEIDPRRQVWRDGKRKTVGKLDPVKRSGFDWSWMRCGLQWAARTSGEA